MNTTAENKHIETTIEQKETTESNKLINSFLVLFPSESYSNNFLNILFDIFEDIVNNEKNNSNEELKTKTLIKYFDNKLKEKEDLKSIARRHCSNASITHLSLRSLEIYEKMDNINFVNSLFEVENAQYNLNESISKDCNILYYNKSYKGEQLRQLNIKYKKILVPFVKAPRTKVWQLYSAIVYHLQEQIEYISNKYGSSSSDKVIYCFDQLVEKINNFIQTINEYSIKLYKRPILGKDKNGFLDEMNSKKARKIISNYKNKRQLNTRPKANKITRKTPA